MLFKKLLLLTLRKKEAGTKNQRSWSNVALIEEIIITTVEEHCVFNNLKKAIWLSYIEEFYNEYKKIIFLSNSTWGPRGTLFREPTTY